MASAVPVQGLQQPVWSYYPFPSLPPHFSSRYDYHFPSLPPHFSSRLPVPYDYLSTIIRASPTYRRFHSVSPGALRPIATYAPRTSEHMYSHYHLDTPSTSNPPIQSEVSNEKITFRDDENLMQSRMREKSPFMTKKRAKFKVKELLPSQSNKPDSEKTEEEYFHGAGNSG